MTVLAAAYDVDKFFHGVHAVKSATLEIHAGEVHCLIGENGAGKSTIVKMLAGVHRPERGRLVVAGSDEPLRSPNHALENGISTVFQELTLVPEMSVAENIWLGREPRRGAFIGRAERVRKTEALLEDLGIGGIEARRPVRTLGIAQQQLVEIAKAVSREGERVVVMDEPTATLTGSETQTLFALVARLRARGVGILYITHRLEELEVVGDRVTVMRDGAVIETLPVADAKRELLIELMVGRKITDLFPPRTAQIGDVVLDVPGKDGEPPLVVRRGEVVGLFGLVGAGRSELARALVGDDPLDRRRLSVAGKEHVFRSPSRALAGGIGIVPEDRKGMGIVPHMSVAGNISLSSLQAVCHGPFLQPRAVAAVGDEYIRELNIKTPSGRQEIVNLSGGNQQKCLIARVLCADPDVVILDEPTRGIDVGARVEVYRLINRLCEEGRGVLMITSDLPEALGMSDRIVVMRRGRIAGEVDAHEAVQETVVSLALGEGPVNGSPENIQGPLRRRS
jgi:ribose transport system ATP-binding protein